MMVIIFIILIMIATTSSAVQTHLIMWSPGARTGQARYTGEMKQGDSIVFSYKPGAHNVIELENRDQYLNCITPPNAKVYTSGNDMIPLDVPGRRFFICGIGNHCKEKDMKLEIHTVDANGKMPPEPPPCGKIQVDIEPDRQKLLESPTHSEFVVGDDQGWNENVDYEAWAKGKEFYMGDILAFNYTKGKHNVIRVDEAAYNECAVPGEEAEALATGNDQITLAWMGNIGFISGIGQDCENGLKLLINIKCPHTRPKPTPALQGGRKLIPSN